MRIICTELAWMLEKKNKYTHDVIYLYRIFDAEFLMRDYICIMFTWNFCHVFSWPDAFVMRRIFIH